MTRRGAQLTEAHRLTQARLGTATAAQLVDAWALIDPANLDGTVERWLRTATRLVAGQRAESARIAGRYLAAYRAVELTKPSPIELVLAEMLNAEQVLTSLTVTGPARVKAATARGIALDTASDLGMTGSARAGMRLALNGGRDTIQQTVDADPRRKGWDRSLSGDPCDFCQSLAAEAAAGDSSAAFVTHDGCGCQPVPVFA